MYIKIHFYLFLWLAFLFWKEKLSIFLLFYLCDFLHEAAHIVVALLLNVNVIELFFMPFGISARYEEYHITSVQECLISLAGPFISLVLFFFSKSMVIQMINLVIFLLNILPLYPLDGGRILKQMLVKLLGKKRGKKAMQWIGVCLLLALSLISLMMLLLEHQSYFLFFTIYTFFLVYDTALKEKIITRIMYLQTEE